jgi:hypothetical protein
MNYYAMQCSRCAAASCLCQAVMGKMCMSIRGVPGVLKLLGTGFITVIREAKTNLILPMRMSPTMLNSRAALHYGVLTLEVTLGIILKA